MSALDPIPVFGVEADAAGVVGVELGAAAEAASPEITPAEPGAGPKEPAPIPEPAMLPTGAALPGEEAGPAAEVAAPAGVAPPL